MLSHQFALFSAAVLSYLSVAANAQECPCGYQTDDSSVYTEVIETDFTSTKNAASLATDWQIQDWKVNLNTSINIPYNRVAKTENVVAGNPKGLQLLVKAPKGLDVGVSELRTARDDIKYGSFRVSMQTTNLSGTCSAFFWYQNDSCEIDIELLSKDINPNSSPAGVANLVIHSAQSSANGFDASSTDSFKRASLAFNPSTDFHEYRFDWKPDSVAYAIDGQPASSMTKNVPRAAGGRVFLNHWSNGSPSWTGAAPSQDATTWVRYVRLYFNSSDPARAAAADARCSAALRAKGAAAAARAKVCDVRRLDAPFAVALPASSSSNGAVVTSTTTLANGAVVTSTTVSRAVSNGAAAAAGASNPVARVGLRESILSAVVLFVADIVLAVF